MTPTLFDLPLRLGDAAALAGILLDQPAGAPNRPLTDEFRSRVAVRARAVRFECMRPLPASIERDPVHPSAWYVCVDGVDGQPLLLRVAPATTPSSGVFPKAILIGRTFVGPREVVLNAVPFGAGDHERILAFAQQVNPAFQPKPFGSRPVLLVSGEVPEEAFPRAFEGFRRVLKTTGQNLAAFGVREGQDAASVYFAGVWSAIRAGWREGFTLRASAPVAPIPGMKGRPFETALPVSREIFIKAGMEEEELAGLFAK